MPEGHTVHRTANDFAEHFVGAKLRIDSPQGRFAPSAALVDGRVLVAARAIGKQLFLDFENGLVVRIHLGIYGKWRWYALGNAAKPVLPAVVGEVRARFWARDERGQWWLADLRGPTVCEVLTPEQAGSVESRLGADPLNPDPDGAEAQRFAERVARSRQSIAFLLMDQSVISGIGNVYRAELLFRARLNPHTPGNLVRAQQLSEIWNDSVHLLQDGVHTGVMITRDEHRGADPGKPERHFVYKREGQPCRVCGTHVAIGLLAGRKLYWCPSCQA